jgi:hypothetical protein
METFGIIGMTFWSIGMTFWIISMWLVGALKKEVDELKDQLTQSGVLKVKIDSTDK